MIPHAPALRRLAAALGLVLASTLGAHAYDNAPGYATTTLNLRAGPGTGYPVVSTLRGGDEVIVYGCTEGYLWCDIGRGQERGWAYGRYLEMNQQNQRRVVQSYGPALGVPIQLFLIDQYWPQHYAQRPFYMQKPKYTGKDFNPHANNGKAKGHSK